MMWLSKDERRLLAGYYGTLGAVDETRAFREEALAGLLRGKLRAAEYGDEPPDTEGNMEHDKLKAAIKQVISDRTRVAAANNLLVARNLIALARHESELGVVILGLTLDGYDLGRRYSSWLTCSHLWFREYKDHWMWLIIAFIGGAIGTKLIDLTVSHFKGP
jgi:hypothetical protein